MISIFMKNVGTAIHEGREKIDEANEANNNAVSIRETPNLKFGIPADRGCFIGTTVA